MIYGIYFSPTNNSKKYVEAICQSIEENAIFFDVTSTSLNHTFTSEDFVVIGAPVYAGRIPHVSKERFKHFKGTNTPCILVATYGNRHYDDALVEMQELFTENGFVVYGACAVIGRHTYGQIAVDRPTIDDLNEASEYAKRRFELNKPLEVIIPGKHHDEDIINKGKFHPLTNNHCVHCMICVNNCPTNAIQEDCHTISNQCISCFRCIRNCPLEAKHMNDEQYNNFASMFTEKLKQRRENEYFE